MKTFMPYLAFFVTEFDALVFGSPGSRRSRNPRTVIAAVRSPEADVAAIPVSGDDKVSLLRFMSSGWGPFGRVLPRQSG